MKKVILCFLILMVCGCQDKPIDKNEVDLTPQRVEILKEKGKELFADEDDKTIGLTMSILNNIIYELPNNKIFHSCNQKTTRIEHIVYELENEINSQYKIILDCDNITTTYFYNTLEDSEPIGIHSIENK